MGLFTTGWGHLGRDVEIAYSQSGFAFGKTAVACKIPKKNQDGSYGATEWVELTFLGTQAENAAKYLKKGSKMWFSGYPQTDEFLDKQTQQKRKSTKVVVQQWESLESRQDNVDGHGPQQQSGQQFGQQQPQQFGQQQPQQFGQQQPQQFGQQQPNNFNPNNPGQPQFGQQPQPQQQFNQGSNTGYPNPGRPNPGSEDVPF